MNECVEQQLDLVKSSGAPLHLEVLKAIATLCGVDPYRLWEWVSERELAKAPRATVTTTARQTQVATRAACWRCPACGRTFESPAKLASHILYFLKKRDYEHVKLYKEIKKKVEETGKTFTKIVEEFRC